MNLQSMNPPDPIITVYCAMCNAGVRGYDIRCDSPKGFSAHACEAVFWHAMGVAGFTEADL